MASAIGQSVGHGRTRTVAPRVAPRPSGSTSVCIVENPLAAQNPTLARAVEDEARDILATQPLGRLDVRFRVCRDERDGLVFICKIESPAPADLHQERLQWRWWSPLMQTAQEFRAALLDAVEIRRQRLAQA
jgi:hypothetical protein